MEQLDERARLEIERYNESVDGMPEETETVEPEGELRPQDDPPPEHREDYRYCSGGRTLNPAVPDYAFASCMDKRKAERRQLSREYLATMEDLNRQAADIQVINDRNYKAAALLAVKMQTLSVVLIESSSLRKALPSRAAREKWDREKSLLWREAARLTARSASPQQGAE